jgi:SAM-dependent methyltransferase
MDIRDVFQEVLMHPDSMTPQGLALKAFFEGDSGARLTVRRDDGLEFALPVGHFFRPAAEFTSLETTALARCRGRVLDIGAGSGLHSLALQARGLDVTALEISPDAVEVMIRRGVRDARCADVFQFREGPFDTLLMLGHGIGVVEDLVGLDRFLELARRLLAPGGRLLLDSTDVRRTDDPRNRAYHEAKRRAGCYIGEVRIQLEFAGRNGPFCGWLHIDPGTLAERASQAGWLCEIIVDHPGGDYLACLEPVDR